MWFSVAVAIVACYLLGNLNGSVSISTLVAHEDVRSQGSGNAGLTNFIRNYGIGSGVLVMVIDVIKAACACYVGGLLLKPYGYYQEGLMLGAICVSLGHDFPALLGFKGGKGILCGVTVAAVIDWRIAVIIFCAFALAYACTQYVSLGSLVGAALLSVLFAVFHHDNLFVMVGGIFIGLLAIFMHRSNIGRLIRGTESKTNLFGKGKKK